jgi:hypothetical protein
MTHIPAPATEADHDRVHVVPAGGELDMTAAPDLSIDLGLAISGRPRAVIADLTAVRSWAPPGSPRWNARTTTPSRLAAGW